MPEDDDNADRDFAAFKKELAKLLIKKQISATLTNTQPITKENVQSISPKALGESPGIVVETSAGRAMIKVNQDTIVELFFGALYSKILYDRVPQINIVTDASIISKITVDESLRGKPFISSAYIDGFKPLTEFNQNVSKIKGVEKAIASMAFLGEYDAHANNLGVNDALVLCKIDHGKSGRIIATDAKGMASSMEFIFSTMTEEMPQNNKINNIEPDKLLESLKQISTTFEHEEYSNDLIDNVCEKLKIANVNVKDIIFDSPLLVSGNNIIEDSEDSELLKFNDLAECSMYYKAFIDNHKTVIKDFTQELEGWLAKNPQKKFNDMAWLGEFKKSILDKPKQKIKNPARLALEAYKIACKGLQTSTITNVIEHSKANHHDF
jgi:hypothetical protein